MGLRHAQTTKKTDWGTDDAVIPELRLAFAFSQKKALIEKPKLRKVLHFLCKAKRIQLFVIRQKEPELRFATENQASLH